MTTLRVTMLFVAGLLWAVWGHAAVDCDLTELPEEESASAYLQDYGEGCVEDEVAAQLEQWELSGADALRRQDFSVIVPAWKDLADSFASLANTAPDGQMKAVYRHLSDRARAAGQSLNTGLEARKLPDNALFRRDSWQNVRMNLSEYKQPGDPYFSDLDIGGAMDADCAQPANARCATTLVQGKRMMVFWRLADELAFSVSTATIEAIAAQVAAKDDLWNRYLYDSKPMLPFDFIATDLIERRWSKSDQYPQGFREPPKRQWFLLHPSFAVEYASAADDGEQMKPVLYLEVIGVNYWDESNRPINAPLLRAFSGASLIVTYADRAGMKDTGVGALLTFDNIYSIGVTRYSSDTAVSLSLDLANLFRDKYKPKYEAWKNELTDY